MSAARFAPSHRRHNRPCSKLNLQFPTYVVSSAGYSGPPKPEGLDLLLRRLGQRR